MQHYLSVGCLARLDVAYSRYSHVSDSPKVSPPLIKTTPTFPMESDSAGHYVQDLMRNQWEELGSWLMAGAAIYVCG